MTSVQIRAGLFTFLKKNKLLYHKASSKRFFKVDFTKDLPGADGCLFKGTNTKTGAETVVYFSSPSGDCGNEEQTAKKMGAELLMEKFEIPEGHGYMIMLVDSEGNRIAVHSQK